MDKEQWASDTPISAPRPNDRLDQMVTVDLGGMVFTPMGIALPVNTALHEQRYLPTWSPQPKETHGRPA